MINRTKDISISYKPFDFYYPIIVGVIIFQMYIPSIRLGVAASVVICILTFIYLKKDSLLFNSFINKLVLLYIAYNTVSLLWFLFTGFPVSVFIQEWSNSILPVFFFYFAHDKKKQNDNFYRITLNALFVSFIIGFALWIWQPPFYRVFMDTTEGVGTDLLSFQSIFGLTATGSLGFIGFLISSNTIFTSNGRKGKIALLVSLVATILTFRRSALFVLAASILAMHFIGYFRYKFLKKRYFVIEAVICYIIYILIADNYSDFFANLIQRGSMISEAINERSDNWFDAFKHGNLIIGGGLGAFGQKVLGYSKIIIADGNYFKMLAEIGAIGILLFLTIIISSLVKGFKDLRNNYLEIGIVIGISIQAIGSNIFTYQIVIPIFWYAVGRLATKNRQNTLSEMSRSNVRSLTE